MLKAAATGCSCEGCPGFGAVLMPGCPETAGGAPIHGSPAPGSSQRLPWPLQPCQHAATGMCLCDWKCEAIYTLSIEETQLARSNKDYCE